MLDLRLPGSYAMTPKVKHPTRNLFLCCFDNGFVCVCVVFEDSSALDFLSENFKPQRSWWLSSANQGRRKVACKINMFSKQLNC